MNTLSQNNLSGFFYHNATGFIGKRIGKTRFSHTYKIVAVRTSEGGYKLSDLNKYAHDNDFVPANDVKFLQDLEITRQEINDELIRTYGFDYSDRIFN